MKKGYILLSVICLAFLSINAFADDGEKDEEKDGETYEFKVKNIESDTKIIITCENGYKEKEEIEENTTFSLMLIEPILLLTLYVIMSQPFVVSMASKYVPQLKPSEDGTIGMTGIMVYGLILTILFLVIRKIIQLQS